MCAVHQPTHGEVVAIDVKTLRCSYNREDRYNTIHMISVYALGKKPVLIHIKYQQKQLNKNNRELIKMLGLRGVLVSIDAMACHKNIINQGGVYLLAEKGNQGK
tara:strand:+ start:776 stop:1087 length:312 start_codon:yes stop_codon:yes gene_type:complete